MKLALKLALGLFLLILVGVGVLFWKINPILESLKPKILAQIESQIGQKVSVGELSLKFFPQISLALTSLEVGTSHGENVGTSSGEKLSLDEVRLKTNLGALLGGKVAVESVVLDGLNIDITKKADGRMFVGPIELGAKAKPAPTPTSDKQPASDSTKPTEPAQSGPALALEISEASLTNSNINFHDESVSPAQTVTLNSIDLRLTDISNAGANIELNSLLPALGRASLSLQGKAGNPMLGMQNDLELKLSDIGIEKLAALGSAYTGKDLLVLALGGEGKKNGQTPGKASGELSYSTKITSSSASAAAVKAVLDLTKTDIQSAMLQKDGATPAIVTVNTAISVTGMPSSMANIAQVLSLDLADTNIQLGDALIEFSGTIPLATPDKAVIEINSSDLALEQLAKILPSLATMKTTGKLNIKLKAAELLAAKKSLTGYVQFAGLGATAPGAPAISNGQGSVEFSGDSVFTEKTNLLIAGQPLDVRFSVSPLPPETADFTVGSDKLDINQILASIKGEPAAAQATTVSGLNVTGNYNLKNSAGTVKATMSSAEAAGLTLGKIEVPVTLNSDAISISNASVALYGGSIGGNVLLSAPGKENSSVNLSLNGQGIDIGGLSQAAMPGGKYYLTGNVSRLGLGLSGALSNAPASLSGPVNLDVSKGSIVGINLLRETLRAVDTIPGVNDNLLAFVPEQYQGVVSANETAFDAITYRGKLENAAIKIDSLDLTHSLYIISAQGSIAFQGAIKINAQLKLTPLMASAMVVRQPKLKLLLDSNNNLTIPLTIIKKGSVPVVVPDVSRLIENAARNTAKDAAKKQVEKLVPKIGGDAGKLIDSLF
ncbi:MAG: AsmA-like C-terminal region-containing protein [bacterium]|nr:AsmA-like C-terminal region-containing protein [bacterium]